MKITLFHSGKHKALPSLALLLLRLVFGGAMLTHGYPKLIHFNEWSGDFMNPFGIGPEVTLGLVVFSELFCAVLLIIGLGTRPAALALAFTMAVAAFYAHAGDSFADRELSVLFLAAYLVLLLLGAGTYSLDKVISKK
jgi:putative oxidoreductase